MRWIAAVLLAAVAGWSPPAAAGPADAGSADGIEARAEGVDLDLWLPDSPRVGLRADGASAAGDGRILLDAPRLRVGDLLSLSAREGDAALDTGEVEVRGDVQGRVDDGQPVEIRAERFRIDTRAGTGRFEGSVEVTQGTLVVLCDLLEVRYDRATQEVLSVTATGGVEIRQDRRRGRGERAEFDRVAGTVVMTGSPVLEEGSARLRGTVIRFDVEGGEVSCEGCRAVFGARP